MMIKLSLASSNGAAPPGCLAGGLFVLVSLLAAPPPAEATCGACSTASGGAGVAATLCPGTGEIGTGTGCGGFPSCQTPVLSGPSFEYFTEPDGEFTVRLSVEVTAPRNHEESNSAFWPQVFWYAGSSAPAPGSGNACLFGKYDKATTYIERQNVTCVGGNFGTFSIRAVSCQNFFPSCAPAALQEGMQFVVPAGSGPRCGGPPVWGCGDGVSCSLCQGPLGAASPAGGGPSLGGKGTGPDAFLYYRAGGAGHPGYPGSAAWNPTLGRYWSHTHAERIVPDPDDSRVWLLTRHATFREFSGLSGGVYTSVKPSDEHRTLSRTATGWELKELDGTVHVFDAAGLWTRTTDRNGNAVVGAYISGRLATVTFPDGQSETYAYHPTGKLASITKTGVDGIASRVWIYTWSGDDLTRIARPDGTALEFLYEDARFSGFMTRWDLVAAGPGGARRVEAAWEYDTLGNVARTWRGDPVATGSGAVDVHSFTFDNRSLPGVTTVTDPLGKVSTYTLGRDTVSQKPKLVRLDGDCPACGTGPNERRTYDDPTHPLLPTRTLDGRGVETQSTYDSKGMTISKTEAAGTPLVRTTSWEYGDAAHPAFPTKHQVPSTSGGAALRIATTSYNAAGDPITRTEQGAEGGSSFSLSTATTFNAAGQPLTIDPPGHGTADATSFTYDPARGNLVALTRTDPLIGTTTFGYDAWNRRTSVIDPNGVETVTAYDALDRVTSVTQKGAVPAEDLVTVYEYNGFGDLFRVTHPRGNVIEYGYDAAGRLVSIEQKPGASTPGERTLFTLDKFGHRTREDLQRWSGTAWVTESWTESVYSSRCHLDKVIYPGGAVTEYAYDCAGNLERVWDANHPRAANPNPTQLYAYDALSRIFSVTQPWTGTGGGTAVTSYGYDVQDHLTRVTDAEGNVTTWTYGDRDLMTAQVSPASGTTTHAYDEHGELRTEIDARGIVTTRDVDVLGRVIAERYPDSSLDVTYTYDDPAVSFSKGRLTRITRHGEAIDYRYDRFGRTLQDGDLSYGYDANGNSTSIVYPGSVEARTTYDFADRPATLIAVRPGLPDQPLVTSSTYLPSGPLTTLTLGNGLTETRTFTNRYFPLGIALTGGTDQLRWNYSTDAEGNILTITDALNAAGIRTYGYQDIHYFLTQGNGPWGIRSWTYDKIGNRLTEMRGAVAENYTYQPAAGGGNTPILSSIQIPAGTRTYTFGPAGHLEKTVLGTEATTFRNDASGRLGALESSSSGVQFLYDGRGYLTKADAEAPPFLDGFETGNVCGWTAARGLAAIPVCTAPPIVRPTYSSEGLLHALFRNTAPDRSYLFYFAGRPVAQLDRTGSTEAWKFLTADHLGTPIAATNTAGALLWQGGFEPFGADWSGAGGAGVFLRLPGQWEEEMWRNASPGFDIYYNVHRWYETAASRYTRNDPLHRPASIDEGYYRYALANPLKFIDPLGLFSIDPFCKECKHPYLARDTRRLSSIIQSEVQAFCSKELNSIVDINLRRCIRESCRSGVISCALEGSQCDDPGNPGYTEDAGIGLHHWLRRNGWLPVIRRAVLCGNNPLNFSGEAGRTVIHEWAHGCGYSAHGAERYPGIPQSEN